MDWLECVCVIGITIDHAPEATTTRRLFVWLVISIRLAESFRTLQRVRVLFSVWLRHVVVISGVLYRVHTHTHPSKTPCGGGGGGNISCLLNANQNKCTWFV